jgi:hypothetical protein
VEVDAHPDDAVGITYGADYGRAFPELSASIDRSPADGSVEDLPWNDHTLEVFAGDHWVREVARPPIAHHEANSSNPLRLGEAREDAHLGQQPHRGPGQAVATALVAREDALLEEKDAPTLLCEEVGRRRTSRARADNDGLVPALARAQARLAMACRREGGARGLAVKRRCCALFSRGPFHSERATA